MQQWKEYFVFTRRERGGILVLLSLILILLITPHFFPRKPDLLKQARWIEIDQELDQKEKNRAARSFADNTDEDDTSSVVIARLFYFDPNNADEKEWRALGVKPRTIQTIKKYVSKGGRFRSPEDLRKIYGLSKDTYDRLAPYVRIKDQDNADARYEKKKDKKPYKSEPSVSSNLYRQQQLPKSHKSEKPRSASQARQLSPIDINSADSLAFVDLPGIGPKLAGRILNFRNRLGGFYKIEQVSEVYGLPDSTFQLIKKYLQCNSGGLRRVSLNAATLEELKQHPYIRWKLASAIIEYRNQHGIYKTVEDLLKIAAMEKETFIKIKPYLSL